MLVFQDEQGFSLLELVVAIALLALISLPLYSGVSYGIRVWSFTHQELEDTERQYLMRAMIARWFERAYPFDVLRAPGDIIYPLEGTLESVSFTAPIHPDSRRDQLSRVTLSNQEGQLVLEVSGDHAVYSSDVSSEKVVLFDGVESLNFAYLATDVNSRRNEQWQNSWLENRQLPSAIRLVVSFTDPDVKWSELVVPFKVTERAFCQPDTGETDQRCRDGSFIE
ncbi:prepilin-type N-terminal cleavage/methylation domain-containing protein [Kordiimonas sp. SCSIO 12603]|uniref:type II secretion system protein GspJ n=1 Tax=Kordiimonas sp. SCSIO 12603 TaxID=2829596 RepID=UPI00210709D9|nr:prepilin-type N-terminal cleavage/methylation domain-containing protein [Kordiimonas sp. SCSIO 12603]UTW58735.1 prepilin-type N-terminal cleavage/methylation domain-containing protein [Kordiimonas sp. SCSIO 12603]